jgi:cell division septum initiation protein DivIVA
MGWKRLFGGNSLPPKINVEAATATPTLSGLGTRVEWILRLAEDQANARLAAADRKADRIVSEARTEAAKILEQARTDAGKILDS